MTICGSTADAVGTRAVLGLGPSGGGALEACILYHGLGPSGGGALEAAPTEQPARLYHLLILTVLLEACIQVPVTCESPHDIRHGAHGAGRMERGCIVQGYREQGQRVGSSFIGSRRMHLIRV